MHLSGFLEPDSRGAHKICQGFICPLGSKFLKRRRKKENLADVQKI
jgi:hypothetical protein